MAKYTKNIPVDFAKMKPCYYFFSISQLTIKMEKIVKRVTVLEIFFQN